MRHNYLNKVWCEAARCAGVAPAVEPLLRAMARKATDGRMVLNKVAHALAQTYLTAPPAFGSSAEVVVAAARLCEDLKGTEYCNDVDGGACTHAPVVLESGGRLCKRALGVLNQLDQRG